MKTAMIVSMTGSDPNTITAIPNQRSEPITRFFLHHRILWTADHVDRELDAAYGYAEGLADAERARVAAKRTGVVLQAAE